MRKKIGIIGGQGACQAVVDMLQAPFDALCASVSDFRQIPQAFESLDAAGVEKLVVDDSAVGDSDDAAEALRSAAESAPGRVIFVTSRPMDDPLLFQLATQAGADIFIPGIQVDAAAVLTRYVEQGSDATERSAWVVADPSDPRVAARRKTMGFIKRRKLGAVPPLSIVERTCGSTGRQLASGDFGEGGGTPTGPLADDDVFVPADDDTEAEIEMFLAEATEEDAEWLGELADEMDPDGAMRAGAASSAPRSAAGGDSETDWIAELDEAQAGQDADLAAAPAESGQEEPGTNTAEDGEGRADTSGPDATGNTAPESRESETEAGREAEGAETAESREGAGEEKNMGGRDPFGEGGEDMESMVEAAVERKIRELSSQEGTGEAPVSWAEPLPADCEAEEEIIPLADLLGRAAPDSEKPGRGNITAIVGTRHGVGCTYLSCILASELAACGERTALVLCNTEDYRNMFRTLNATLGSSEYCFKFNDIDVFNWRNRKTIRASAYDQIVYDLGTTDLSQPDGDTPASLFMRANLQILMMSVAPWDLHCVNDYLLNFNPDILRNLTWAFWGAGKRGRESLLHGLRGADALGPNFNRLFTVQARPDFFSAEFKPQLDLYRNLLSPVLPKNLRSKKRGADPTESPDERPSGDKAAGKGTPDGSPDREAGWEAGDEAERPALAGAVGATPPESLRRVSCADI